MSHSENHGAPTSSHETKASTPNVKQSKIAKYITGAIVVIVVLIALLIIRNKQRTQQAAIISIPQSTEKTSQNTENKGKDVKWIFDHSEKINFTGEYSEKHYFSSGMGMSFSGPTESYCVKNKDDKEVCGEAGEDVSTKLPGSNANTELRFKSQNGKNGEVTVNLYRPE
jgi:uncharacterized protein YxeA